MKGLYEKGTRIILFGFIIVYVFFSGYNLKKSFEQADTNI